MDQSKSPLEAKEINDLLTRLDELVRWRPGSKGKYHEVHGALARVLGRSNHVITGRRGSGKTRLLDELKKKSLNRNIIVITIGAEDYKELTYPDILIQILRNFLRSFRSLLEERPTILTRAWLKNKGISIKSPIKTRERKRINKELLSDVNRLFELLESIFMETEELEAMYQSSELRNKSSESNIDLSMKSRRLEGKTSVKSGEIEEYRAERHISQREQKRIKVERLLGDFKVLLNGICNLFNRSIFLAVDDFYFINRSDQPKVIDYIHRICKDTNAFLKVTTIKHRSQLFEFDGVARGVVAGHEIQSIELEGPLGQLESITRFMKAVWTEVCDEVKIRDSINLFQGDGFFQAVLASGGVPRDFFGVVRRGILIARERNEKGVGKIRINEAAKIYLEETKLPELETDIGSNTRTAELLLFDLVRFARDTKKKNCFHVNLDQIGGMPKVRYLFDALVDSRLIHLITDNTSNAHRGGRYVAYLLDVGLYGHPLRRGPKAMDEVEFWSRDEAGRLFHLQRSPVYPLRDIDEINTTTQAVSREGIETRKAILTPDLQNSEDDTSRPQMEQLNMLFPPIVEE